MPAVSEFSTTRTEIGGIPVTELAKQFGTPTYVYDATKIVERINDLSAFDAIRYAQKANSNIAIVDLVRRHGVLVDAVSAGEIHRALAAGYKPGGEPPAIVFTADIFDHDALALVVEHDIHVNCGSPDMIDQLGEVAPGRNITLRVNPGFGHGHSQKTNTGGEQSKHGIWHEQIDDCLRRADHYGLGVTGLHMHIGSGTDLEHLAQVCGAMETLAFSVGRTITNISAGGGLPVAYKQQDSFVDIEQYFGLWDATRKRLAESFGHKISLEIEPGRYLSAESGYLIAEIRAIKRMGGNTFYIVDAGFNNLARPIMYGSYHPISIAPASGDVERGEAVKKLGQAPRSYAKSLQDTDIHSEPVPFFHSLGMQDVVVGGPLCESGDIFTQEEGGFVAKRSLPVASIGDYLVIECAGAYGFVMSSNYNSKPMAAEVLIQGENAHLVRARQTYQDLLRGESIPPQSQS
ncbi:MAG TPA: diaminopimelate decarboxylase [Pirellulaceae bacterium]|nr:diaminopimelate decarboxylase [Pirellulaceae bacterium]